MRRRCFGKFSEATTSEREFGDFDDDNDCCVVPMDRPHPWMQYLSLGIGTSSWSYSTHRLYHPINPNRLDLYSLCLKLALILGAIFLLARLSIAMSRSSDIRALSILSPELTLIQVLGLSAASWPSVAIFYLILDNEMRTIVAYMKIQVY